MHKEGREEGPFDYGMDASIALRLAVVLDSSDEQIQLLQVNIRQTGRHDGMRSTKALCCRQQLPWLYLTAPPPTDSPIPSTSTNLRTQTLPD